MNQPQEVPDDPRDPVLTAAIATVEQVVREAYERQPAAGEELDDLLDAVRGADSLLRLSDWLAVSFVTRRFCLHPECFLPPRPLEGQGRPPLYCATPHPSIPGAYAHNRDTSRSRRQTLEREHRRTTAGQDAVREGLAQRARADAGRELDAAQRPLTVRLATLSELPAAVGDLRATIAGLADRVDRFAADLDGAADPRARAEEIAAIEHRAATLVALAGQRTTAAEQAAERETRSAQASWVHTDEANAAADEAREEAAVLRAALTGLHAMVFTLLLHARDEVALARDAQARAEADAARRVEQAGAAADEAVSLAQSRFDQELRDITDRADQRVRDAEDARDAAVARVQRAEQAALDADAERGRVRDELREVRETLDRTLREHPAELERVRRESDARSDERVADLRATLEQTYRAQIDGLTQALDALRQRAERAERQLDAAAERRTDTPG